MAQDGIAVVGAGIGGLTAPVALRAPHGRCEGFERARSLSAAGGGLQVSPNAAAVLHDRGLGAALRDAVRPVRRELRRWRGGELIARQPLQGYGAGYYTVRRSALCRELLAAARRAHGPA